MSLIDTHVHFDSNRFDHDRDTIYQRAKANGIDMMIVPAISRAQWPGVTTVARNYPGVFACYGLHPMFTREHTTTDLTLLEEKISQNPCVAIGECGLDGSSDQAAMNQQLFYFSAQLQIARDYNLPVIVHARAAVEAVILELRKNGPDKGVVHSYNGSLQQAHRLIDLGYYLSFGGPITYNRASKLHTLIRQLPLDRIMIETDAPDQVGSAHYGNRNEPCYLPEVLTAVANLRNENEVTIARASNRNACELFGLPDI
ncbi:hypothetical protein AB833_25625 [Chromatiales bacterium (ex Bugula neritina AB1)]|nr:hypothetical protein AB833_25625 [Chromatiales bacterium (ex Bugula neritina AB1)]